MGREFVQNQLTGRQASKSDLEKSMVVANSTNARQLNPNKIEQTLSQMYKDLTNAEQLTSIQHKTPNFGLEA